MGKTKNTCSGSFRQLRGRVKQPLAGPGADEIEKKIISCCQESPSALAAGLKIIADGQKMHLNTILPGEHTPLLAHTLAGAYFYQATDRVDISGHRLSAREILDKGLGLRSPLEPEYISELIGELRWSLALSFINDVEQAQPDLALAYQRIADQLYTCRQAPLDGVANNEYQADQADQAAAARKLLFSEGARMANLDLDAEQQAAVDQALLSLDLLFQQPMPANAYQQAEEALFLSQEEKDRSRAQPVGDVQERMAINGRVASDLLNSIILANLSILIDRQRAKERFGGAS